MLFGRPCAFFGNPLQCACLKNPRDGGAWWAVVSGVAQRRTWLKWLSSNSSKTKEKDQWLSWRRETYKTINYIYACATNLYFCQFQFFNVWKMVQVPSLHILYLFINICNHCFCLYLEVPPGEHQWFSPSCLYTPHSTIIIIKIRFKVGWRINSEYFKNSKWNSIFFFFF